MINGHATRPAAAVNPRRSLAGPIPPLPHERDQQFPLVDMAANPGQAKYQGVPPGNPTDPEPRSST
jgi:hypothetical protein